MSEDPTPADKVPPSHRWSKINELTARNAELVEELKILRSHWNAVAKADQEDANNCTHAWVWDTRGRHQSRASTRRMDCEDLERIIEKYHLASEGE